MPTFQFFKGGKEDSTCIASKSHKVTHVIATDENEMI